MAVPPRSRGPAAAARALCAAIAAVGASASTALPALAQSAASRIDQPTPATLPPGTGTARGGDPSARAPNGGVAPPSAISASTDVMAGGGAGRDKAARTDPLDHLSPEYKR